MSFYLTLPSDSSMSYFANNKTSHYVVRMPKPIELQGIWEVALVEFIYPHTWYNVNDSNNLIGFDVGDGKTLARRIPAGFYGSVPQIIKAIATKEQQNKIYFNYIEQTRRVSVKVKNKARVIFQNGLAQLLGFHACEIACPDGKSEHTLTSPQVADPCSHYRVLMVYSDIVEPQVIGDVLAPLLRIVNVTGSDGEVVCVQYDRAHYLPVSRKIIDTLEIVIRTHLGDLTPFQRGRSYVKLHFRQKYL